jgi:hypothetical protein
LGLLFHSYPCIYGQYTHIASMDIEKIAPRGRQIR